MVGCMVGTSLGMAPAVLLAQDADFVDLDGPLLLARDREPGPHLCGFACLAADRRPLGVMRWPAGPIPLQSRQRRPWERTVDAEARYKADRTAGSSLPCDKPLAKKASPCAAPVRHPEPLNDQLLHADDHQAGREGVEGLDGEKARLTKAQRPTIG